MGLPVELHRKIFAEVMDTAGGEAKIDTDHLKNLRLFCKPFRDLADEVLFDRLFISPNSRCIKKATIMVERFGALITEIVLIPMPSEPMSRKFPYAIIRTADDLSTREHIDQINSEFKKIHADCQDLVQSGALREFLSFALKRLPKLKKIAVGYDPPRAAETQQDRWYPLPLQYLTIQGVESCSLDPCPLGFNKRPHPPHVANFCEVSHWRDCPLEQLWIPFMVELAQSKVCIQQIEMDPQSGYGFNSQPSLLPQAALTFIPSLTLANLSRLQLYLRPSIFSGSINSSDSEAAKHQAVIRAAMSHLPKLMSLKLGMESDLYKDQPDQTPFRISTGILEDCNFPKLQVLDVSSYNATETELSRLPTVSPNLKDVRLSECYIFSGSWAVVVESFRDNAALEKIEVLDPRQSGLVLERYKGINQEVQDFLFNKGANPFHGADIWCIPGPYRDDEEWEAMLYMQ